MIGGVTLSDIDPLCVVCRILLLVVMPAPRMTSTIMTMSYNPSPNPRKQTFRRRAAIVILFKNTVAVLVKDMRKRRGHAACCSRQMCCLRGIISVT